MGNKSILMSIKPQYVAKILNGEKTIEVRKKFPKDYIGWVYIYCTKGKDKLYRVTSGVDYSYHYELNPNTWCETKLLNGEVVGRFWCDKISVIERYCGGFIPIIGYTTFLDKRYSYQGLKEATCLNDEELYKYLGSKNGYAIHISKLEVFDKPMLITMFRKPEFSKITQDNNGNRLSLFERLRKYSINKAPQSWCYIEGE